MPERGEQGTQPTKCLDKTQRDINLWLYANQKTMHNDCFVPRVEVHEMGLSPSAFFRRTGYYLKQLDPNNAMGLRGGNLYVIVLNTNLGAANAQQTAALLNDLAWVQQKRGGVYLLGHHPHVMANPALVPEGRLRPNANGIAMHTLCTSYY